jgi:hypothetical protein
VRAAVVGDIAPRLVDVDGAGRYLGGVSDDVVRDLMARGVLRPVRFPGAGGRDLRRLLFDVVDLDELVERMKDPAP